MIALLLSGMWRVVAARPELLRPEVSEQEVQRILRRAAPNLGFHVRARGSEQDEAAAPG